ncbi:Phosphoacetylglucosamine mutase [Hypsibius exemplaris]|uniref:Phosphoacetylglucosamine mutase n=1 Tax=Hypsibius exemplaris TaxID=2072580 RepID=A0A1W0XEY6_HYPEX|nr:Phosphoacetylglucosamine mutase [Hypsibius exemplaris]
MNFSKVKEKIKNGYPKGTDRSLSYGTAGFRGPANNLDWVMFRMGLLGALRSKSQKGRAIGAMITASHNPVGDNGIKLIDPNGEMLEASWEGVATDLVNAGDVDVINVLKNIVARFNIDASIPAIVYVAQDTRPSSDILSAAVRDGVEALGASAKDFHLLTTPQLHHIVNVQNSQFGSSDELDALAQSSPAQDASEEGYYAKLSEAFVSLLRLRGEPSAENHYETDIYVDGSNGIGAMKMASLRGRLTGGADVKLPTIRIFNDGKAGVLNEGCGADFVKTTQKAPKGAPYNGGIKHASFDGDADRIIYFYFDEAHAFHMLDGDKISALISSFFIDLVRESGLDLKIGVIQTAYANGASTNYIENVLKVPVACVSTGVKYLHHKAKDYDIGIYFEANGHGTVLFSPRAEHILQERISGACGVDVVTGNGHGHHHRKRRDSHVFFKTDGDGAVVVEEILAPSSTECRPSDAEQLQALPVDDEVLKSEEPVMSTEEYEVLADLPALPAVIPKDELVLKHEREEAQEFALDTSKFVPLDEVALKLADNAINKDNKIDITGDASSGVAKDEAVKWEKDLDANKIAGTDGTGDLATAITNKKKNGTEAERLAVEKLLLASKVINQTVGDALADLLLVEAVLYLKGLAMREWDALYQDLPNRLLKVKVSDRNVVQTTDAERKCSAPSGLQAAIDQAVRKYHSGRAFVRPSGTEDVVRVYAEADTQEDVDKLAQEVALAVFQLAGGVGQAPGRLSY